MQYRGATPSSNRNADFGQIIAAAKPPCRTNTAGFLTPIYRMRRLFDSPSGLASRIAVVILMLGAGPLAAKAPETKWQPIADIEKTAEDFVRNIIGTTDNRTRPQVGRLDRRLQLPQCTEDLEAFQQRGAKITSRTMVGVRCNGSSPWKIYVAVDVIVTDSVLVTHLPLPSGHIFSANDVITAQRDVSRLIGGYISRPENLIGKQLKHPLMAGRVVTPSMLSAQIMIRRGQSVTILAQNSGLSIRMIGKALSDGVENQRIRVENATSKRVVEGIVRSPEHVEVMVY